MIELTLLENSNPIVVNVAEVCYFEDYGGQHCKIYFSNMDIIVRESLDSVKIRIMALLDK